MGYRKISIKLRDNNYKNYIFKISILLKDLKFCNIYLNFLFHRFIFRFTWNFARKSTQYRDQSYVRIPLSGVMAQINEYFVIPWSREYKNPNSWLHLRQFWHDWTNSQYKTNFCSQLSLWHVRCKEEKKAAIWFGVETCIVDL